MKDFRLDRKTEKDYIKNVDVVTEMIPTEGEKKKSQKTITIKLADGRYFENISYCEENLETIIKTQTTQAKKGVENLPAFKGRKTKAGVMTGASIVGGPIIGAVAATLLPNPLTVAIGAGILTVMATIPSLYMYLSNKGKVEELEKIKYRDEHMKKLKSYPNYENALAGLPEDKAEWFEKMSKTQQDPFCILKIDEYNQKDLQQIVDNIDTENKYGFQYVKKTTSNK